MGTLQQIGGKINSTREVELNTLAARSVVRSLDALRGSYSFSTNISWVVLSATSAVTNAPILGLQWTSETNLLMVKNLTVSVSGLGMTTSTGGLVLIKAFRAYPFLQQFDLYGPEGVTNVWQTVTAKTLAIGSGNRFRSTMLASDTAGLTYSDIANTTIPTGGGGTSVGTTVPGSTIVVAANSTTTTAPTLAGGVSTQETQPFGAFATGMVVTAGAIIPQRFNPPAVLFDVGDSGNPLIFENMSGIVINYSAPAMAGGITFQMGISMEWDESPAY
jgi:hypothetical protein